MEQGRPDPNRAANKAPRNLSIEFSGEPDATVHRAFKSTNPVERVVILLDGTETEEELIEAYADINRPYVDCHIADLMKHTMHANSLTMVEDLMHEVKLRIIEGDRRIEAIHALETIYEELLQIHELMKR